MKNLGIFDRFAGDLLALQADVERAGCAWACPYSSSDEFEAAIIRSRRHAGAVYVIYAGATTATLAVLVLMF
jgi:hypothetical protein